MTERVLSIRISIESVEIKTLCFHRQYNLIEYEKMTNKILLQVPMGILVHVTVLKRNSLVLQCGDEDGLAGK